MKIPFLLCLCLFVNPLRALSVEKAMIVVGVIVAKSQTESLAVLRDTSGRVFSARVAQEIGRGISLERITRQYVYISEQGKTRRVTVGAASAFPEILSPVSDTQVERLQDVDPHKGTVRLSSQYRDHLVKDRLSEILMQVAAVPYYKEGSLNGFKLHEIDEGSIFDQMGFENGDIVVSINDQSLSDVGMAIKTLHAMRTDTEAQVGFIRSGAEHSMSIIVD